ncbi:hypothetical protein B0J18DRAFT_424581 [Chaetomium sp. MPI-SDFR-AT-0129]|nr:hypothetical protein B0J18DRAFT_424581 [Chaetomium sp. MPI-SDFR-AT-0129]
MRRSPCIFNSAAALRTVFLGNAAVSETPGHLQRLLLPGIQPVPARFVSPAQRPFSTHPILRGHFKRYNPEEELEQQQPKAVERMSDYGITYQWIQLRREDGTLDAPRRTADVLQTIDLEWDTLVLLAAPRASEEDKGPEFAVCAVRTRAPAQQKPAVKEPPAKVKMLELNWAIGAHDLRRKLTRMQELAKKGYLVQVILTMPKMKSKRRASDEEVQATYDAVMAAIAEVPGIRELKKRDGDLGKSLILYVKYSAEWAKESAEQASASSTEEGSTPSTEGALDTPRRTEAEAVKADPNE